VASPGRQHPCPVGKHSSTVLAWLPALLVALAQLAELCAAEPVHPAGVSAHSRRARTEGGHCMHQEARFNQQVAVLVGCACGPAVVGAVQGLQASSQANHSGSSAEAPWCQCARW
jgi:hypothetical protein